MDVDCSVEELVSAMGELIKSNGAWPCYIRPIVLRGYGEMGVSPLGCPVEVYIANYPWGKYLGGDGHERVDNHVSFLDPMGPDTPPVLSEAEAQLTDPQAT